MCSPGAGEWPSPPKHDGHLHTIESADGSEFPIYVSHPDGSGPWPTVVILHDYYDPEHFYHELAKRYADAGYAAVVPHLFHRQGPLSEQTVASANQRIASVTDQGAFDDVSGLLDYLREKGIASGLALTGFCWGGRMSYLVAARFDAFKLLAPFYGHLVAWSGPEGPKPYAPLDEAAKIHTQVIGFYGGADQAIPVENVHEMEASLRAAGNRADLHIYDGAPHGFFRSADHAETSQDAWDHLLAGLRETIGDHS